MGEVRRKRPWEDRPSTDENEEANSFVIRIIICTLIIGSILITKGVKSTDNIKAWIHTELMRSVSVEEVTMLRQRLEEIVSQYQK